MTVCRHLLCGPESQRIVFCALMSHTSDVECICSWKYVYPSCKLLRQVGEVEIQNAERYAGIAPATSPSSAHPPCQSVSPVEENVGQKRPRSRGATGDIAPAGVMLLQANGSPRNHGLVIPGDARNRVHSPRVTSMGSAGISFRHSTGGDGTFGISASRTPKVCLPHPWIFVSGTES